MVALCEVVDVVVVLDCDVVTELDVVEEVLLALLTGVALALVELVSTGSVVVELGLVDEVDFVPAWFCAK